MKKTLLLAIVLMIWVTQFINLGQSGNIRIDIKPYENKTCSDSNNLYVFINYSYCDKDGCAVENTTQTYYCPHGCDDVELKCKPAEWKVNAIVMGGIAVLIIIIAWVVKG